MMETGRVCPASKINVHHLTLDYQKSKPFVALVTIAAFVTLCASAACNEKALASTPSTKDHEFFKEFKQSRPTSPLTAKYAEAIYALDHGKHKTATKLFTELSTEDPKWPGFWTSLGTCCMWNEDFKNGLEYATKAMQLRPKDPDMYNRRAIFLLALMRNDDAIADLSKGLTIDPNDADLLKHRAECYKAMKKYPQAIVDIDRLLKLYPAEETIYYTKAGALEAMKDWKGAIEAYSVLLKRYPTDDHVLVKRASARMKNGDFKGAVIDYSDALKHETEGPEFIYSQRAIAYDKLGMKDKAARDRKLSQEHQR